MVDHQITNHALRHVLRIRDRNVAFAGREALHLNDGAVLSLHLLGKLIESLFCLRAQDLLSGTEANLGVRDRLILVKRAESLLNGVEASAGDLNALLRLLSAVAGIDGVLVRQVGFGICLVNTLLRTRIHVFDVLRVGRCELIQLVHAIADRRHLALDVFLPREWI